MYHVVILGQLGMIFESVDDFRDVVTRYALQNRVLIEKYVNEPTRVRVRCTKDNCNWLLFASLESVSNNFIIRTYNPVHKCERASRNYLCNSKFLPKVFKDRITEQPNIRIFNLQELIRKKFKVHVGKNTARRARAKVLQQIMSDHKVEFGRILDYMDELLRINPGSTYVVKLGEPNELGRLVFCRKCIGLDDCFLKSISRGKLLVTVDKDGNNQILPLAWVVVEYEKKRLMGMGVFQAENGFTAINPGLPSSRIVSTRSSTKITISADVTSDIGFTPTNGHV
ncbi:uncharacterized protein LOC142175131 [Nicotiana tabacum]|uniref:Uncharacterized protein LOC142175131 n=1 Tax=Nicotiana tabacum TaxID=4097 RepID=A0AC58TKP4_TOBAC